MSTEIKDRIKSATKDAMRAKEKERLTTLRLIQAEIKRIEVDERIDVDDQRLLAVLDKMCKQRRDSITQFEDAGRDELAAKERQEMLVIEEFLPQALSEDEITTIVADAISSSGASAPGDMGKVMAIIKPQVQGRADMGAISKMVKAQLTA